MRRVVLALTLALLQPAHAGERAPPQPVSFTLELVRVANTHPTEWLFVVGAVGFRSVPELQAFLTSLPAGTTVNWSPGCKRSGDEPLLSDEAALAAFKRALEEKHVRLIIHPSG